MNVDGRDPIEILGNTTTPEHGADFWNRLSASLEQAGAAGSGVDPHQTVIAPEAGGNLSGDVSLNGSGHQGSTLNGSGVDGNGVGVAGSGLNGSAGSSQNGAADVTRPVAQPFESPYQAPAVPAVPAAAGPQTGATIAADPNVIEIHPENNERSFGMRARFGAALAVAAAIVTLIGGVALFNSMNGDSTDTGPAGESVDADTADADERGASADEGVFDNALKDRSPASTVGGDSDNGNADDGNAGNGEADDGDSDRVETVAPTTTPPPTTPVETTVPDPTVAPTTEAPTTVAPTTTEAPAPVDGGDSLAGGHGLTLQWISWDDRGSIDFTPLGDETYLVSGVQNGENGEYVRVDGTITKVSDLELSFDGTVEMKLSFHNTNEPCVREGKTTFLSTQNRKYWRMQWLLNPCDDTTTDYVDIYFD